MEDYYQILGISPQATQAEVRHSFRKLALLFHPDKNKTVEGEERFKEINRAYGILNNPEKRALYDLTLLQGYPPQAAPQPSHRDPAYRRRRSTPYAQREAQPNVKELMAEYLPKFRWVCYVSLVITLVTAIDYLLPFNNYNEDIAEINRIYRTGRGGGMIYDHDELITRSGIIIRLHENDVAYFKAVNHINIQQTRLFKKNVIAAIPSGRHSVRVAAIYGNLFFVPVVLFISALLGVTIRNSVEFPFNLSIVSFILLIIVAFLLTR
ncbi:MAG: J domain-containing protein [Cyclobacteriaceae bacterium]